MVVSTATITTAYTAMAAAAAAGLTVFQDAPLRALVAAAEAGNRPAVRGIAVGLLAGLPHTGDAPRGETFRWLGATVESRHLTALRKVLVELEHAG